MIYHSTMFANSQLPQDIMHVILEGVFSLEVKLMLFVYISDKKYFTIDFLNERIMSFSYGKSEARNKIPKALEIDHLLSRQSKLRLSGMFWCVGWCMFLLLLFFIIFFLYYAAAQMWNLAIYLPFFIADKVPEDDCHWEKFYYTLLQKLRASLLLCI